VNAAKIVEREEQRHRRFMILPFLAVAAGVPLSVWIRERLRRIARDELREAGKELPF